MVDFLNLVKVKTQHANMAKLSVLYKQLMFVKKEIEEVVEDIRINSIINEVEIKCKKYANQKYFLYILHVYSFCMFDFLYVLYV